MILKIGCFQLNSIKSDPYLYMIALLFLFSVIHNGGEMVSIYSNTLPDATEVQSRKHWTESYVNFSSMGTYLATCHAKVTNC